MSDVEFGSADEAEEELRKLAGSLLNRELTKLDAAPLDEGRYRMLLEQIQAVTFMATFDPDLPKQHVYVSPQIESLLGYTWQEWLGDPFLWYARLHPEERTRWNEQFARTISEGEAVREVYRFLHRDGRVVWILGDVRIQRDPASGLPRYVQGVGFDVTVLKETEEKLRRRTEELEAAKEELRQAKERELAAQRKEIVHLRAEVQRDNSPDALIGASEPMCRLREDIRRFAPGDLTVLVTGPSGTGKELVARALHYSSPRAPQPFVAVNSAAIQDSLVNSELFGHEKGAFTDAKERRIGRFEQAHGGTLFLDEIGDMPLSTQAMILRVLESRSFERVGGRDTIQVDVRVVCATNRDLAAKVADGTFREDLFYRINAVELSTPALRGREGDVLALAEHYLNRANREQKCQVKLSDAAKSALMAHAWPGNVRELKNAIGSAVRRCRGKLILPDDLPPAVAGRRPMPEAALTNLNFYEHVEQVERTLIVDALTKARGVKAEAARGLSLNVNTLTNKMTYYGIVASQEAPWVRSIERVES